MIRRRPAVLSATLPPLLTLVLGLGLGTACATTVAEQPTSPSQGRVTAETGPSGVREALAALEDESGAVIGVRAVEAGTGRTVSYRARTRLPHASTFKSLLAGVLLDRLDADGLDERVRWRESDLVDNSPVTEQHVADGLTVRQLLRAMLEGSDNTAANLLMERLGGPDGLERELRALGNRGTRTDRTETALNSAVPGDPRDTSTPAALADTLGDLLLGDALVRGDRVLLERIMRRTTTADGLVRAVVPDDWTVADRSGAAAYGTRTVVAVVRRPDGPPFVITVLTTYPDEPDREWADDLVADVSRLVVAELVGGGLRL